jgi:creatinine amidohydrolase/Fe(II)-dependent formamide hydrolase-like protein
MPIENSNLELNKRMDDWGPFEQNEGKWLIFSIGNPYEGHGYALPRNMDDFFGQKVAHLISCKTGSRYCGHIPWATDGAGGIARDWAPNNLLIKDLVRNVIRFLSVFITAYKEMGLPSDRIFIFTGHGGNNILADYTDEIKQELNLKDLIITTTGDIIKNANKIMEASKHLTTQLAKNREHKRKIAKSIVKILLTAGHASHMEHSLAASIGILDEEKLLEMNKLLTKNFEEALSKWPPLGGLGGYLLAGGKYTEALGTEKDDKFGLWNCLKGLKDLDQGRIKPIKELGDLIINTTVDYFSEILLKK